MNPTEQITRLLCQKPTANADADENVRVALSVLQDNGWQIDRVGLDLHVQCNVTRQPVFADDSRLAQAQSALEAAEMRFCILRAAVVAQGGSVYFAAAGGFGCAWLLNSIHAGAICAILAVLCFSAGIWHRRRYSKGAKA